MELQKELSDLVETLKTERDELMVKLHLASMDIKDEFNDLDEKWDLISEKASEAANDAVEVSEDAIAKAKVVGEELKEAYQRIRARLSE